MRLNRLREGRHPITNAFVGQPVRLPTFVGMPAQEAEGEAGDRQGNHEDVEGQDAEGMPQEQGLVRPPAGAEAPQGAGEEGIGNSATTLGANWEGPDEGIEDPDPWWGDADREDGDPPEEDVFGFAGLGLDDHGG